MSPFSMLCSSVNVSSKLSLRYMSPAFTCVINFCQCSSLLSVLACATKGAISLLYFSSSHAGKPYSCGLFTLSAIKSFTLSGTTFASHHSGKCTRLFQIRNLG